VFDRCITELDDLDSELNPNRRLMGEPEIIFRERESQARFPDRYLG
jgi:hypothetical protein